eukprot:TRINITY_DN8740_c0_g2_i3.p1 TRINITY_DN8740_c0_g2~~TRINITY_DN8740_c0_g2_i3.p1  ORF type:complete len:898 (+),score=200.14 TRINITY_DN8740_c0_g2_i3:465-3158(+)
MGTRTCMNASCGATSATEWKRGWELRSGGFANLCDKCGSAYEKLIFCDMFHLNESGWRECNSCGKIPSDVLQESTSQSSQRALSFPGKSLIDEKMNELHTSEAENILELQTTPAEFKVDDDSLDKVRLAITQNDSINSSLGHIKREQVMLPIRKVGSTGFSHINQVTVGASQAVKRDYGKDSKGEKDMHETLAHACLSMSLVTSNPSNFVEASYNSGTPNLVMALHGAEGREQNKVLYPFQQGQRSRHLLPKPPKMSSGTGLETSKDAVSQIRVARPPGEGRGRNQLLPRYWPRITDQELQQISGDSNSTIVPLFEKVLSASDAGRIGRLVLPKACAEAYFPPISQPEGLPLKIQDGKGKDWVFQFRFWPNNNSRMYVLEGVTPCIQSMQLQAGDTVTFSRIDPEGKLFMGFRKASNSMSMQDTQVPSVTNGALSKETFYSGVTEKLPIINGYSGLLQLLKGSADPHLSAFSEHLNSSDGDISWIKTGKNGGRPNEDFLLQSTLPERKKSRNISSKSKRLHIDAEDALELKLTWEEAQDLLRPPPSVKPSIVIVDDHEFEEYEEPPVFGKRTIFTAQPSAGLDQWAQCDSCNKWRRLPVDALLPPKWTCADNTWDPRRSSCSVPDELSSKETENLQRLNRDFRKRKIAGSYKPAVEREASGLDALATAAVLGDDGNPTTPSIATTTKHPRHRPGCTCIVCIQPPSGKGPKHKPTCTCNVCMTVKRRFKTLMMRKKKRQSEREAESALTKKHAWAKDDIEVDSASRCLLPQDPVERDAVQSIESESGQSKILIDKAEMGKGQIDLNCHPEREDDLQSRPARVSMMSLLHAAGLPLETYLKQNGLASLISEQQASSGSHVLPQVTGESEGRLPDESYLAKESVADEGHCAPNHARNDPL